MIAPGLLLNALLCGATLWLASATPASAEPVTPPAVDARTAEPDRLIALDIRAQPLAGAIEIYAKLTGLQVMYDARLAEGRRSLEIKGVFTAEAALRALLEGSGLMARYAGREALVIIPAPRDRAAAANLGQAALRSASVSQRHYYALVQASLRKAFCAGSETRSASFRIALNLWIGPGGVVQAYKMAGSTGAPSLDRAVDEAMRRVVISEPPPRDLAQPFTIVILPKSPGADCP